VPCNRHGRPLCFSARGRYAGGDDGFTRRTQRHAEWPARPQHAERRIRQGRHVTNDHGHPGTAGLESGQAFHQSARRGPTAGAGTNSDTRSPAWQCRRSKPGSAAGGGLSDLLKGGLGGLLAGGAAGTVLSGGLGDLLKQLQDNGLGDQANSWVSNGPNKQVAPGDLANALGADQIDHISAQSGLSRDDLLRGLSQYLPDAINHLTPDGRLPKDDELSGRI
jgi:uncharacterized protein YidB (DUF937 family)